MTDFISWVDAGGILYYLTDVEVFSRLGKERLADSKDNDYIGHGAIREFYQIGTYGLNCQLLYFWEVQRLPSELAEKIQDFDNHWGRMFKVGYFMNDDLRFIIERGPEEWKTKAAKQLLTQKSTYYDLGVIQKYAPSVLKA